MFGTVAVFLYPSIGRALALPQPSFGLWAGVAVHDTSQVIATSAAYGPGALDVATVVKLIRNALMAPLLAASIAADWAARDDGGGRLGPPRGPARDAAVRPRASSPWPPCGRVGVIDADEAIDARHDGPDSILVAAGCCRDVDPVGELRETSWRPLAVGFGGGARHRARQPRGDH